MQVGIITFHHTTNYGATLQAYALSKAIRSQGHNVELIDYRPYVAARAYLGSILPIKYRKNKLCVNRYTLKELLKSLKMRKFLLANMPLSRDKFYTRAGLENLVQHYDMVICGSDQIWCLNSFRGFDPSFFLDFVSSQNNCRKISYAASFGNTENLGKNKNSISQLISEFHAISVRDSNSLRLIQQECNRQATKVLDPTFLIEYSEIISEPKFKKDYVLIYHQSSLTLEEETFVKSIAEINKLEIISIGRHNRIASKNLIGIGPKKWLGYFKNAFYVITNTYHGTIFSIIFKKPFSVLNSKGKTQTTKTQKINDLLKYLNLESRIGLTQKSYSQGEYASINYASVYEKLEKEVLSSKNYLFEALDGKHTSITINNTN